jgi:hypothetical protein
MLHLNSFGVLVTTAAAAAASIKKETGKGMEAK